MGNEEIQIKEFKAVLTKVDITGSDGSPFAEDQLQLQLPGKNLVIHVSSKNQDYLKIVYFDLITYCVGHKTEPFKFLFSFDESEKESTGVQEVCKGYIEILNEDLKQIFTDIATLNKAEGDTQENA